MSDKDKYDVALSFAGEDRPYVDSVAHALRGRGIKVFYDLFEEADLWGKDLYTHLSDVYQNRARFTVMFISEAYSKKLWSNHERRAAQARAFQESQEYILPSRFDNTEIPGVLPTIGYISLDNRSPDDLSSLIVRKIVGVGGSVPTDLVRKDYGTSNLLPDVEATRFVVSVNNSEGAAITKCQVMLQADNGTALDGLTDQKGLCELLVKTQRLYKLLIGHPEYPALMIERVDPGQQAKVTLPITDNVGSVIIRGTGYLPGLIGRLNPIKDTTGATYLYADNIAVNGGQRQPTGFEINVPLELEDVDGTVIYASVKHIEAAIALVQFTRRS